MPSLLRTVAVSAVLGIVAVAVTYAIEASTQERCSTPNCQLWMDLNLPAFVIAAVLSGNPHGSDSFLPFAVGVFAQWFIAGIVLGAMFVSIRRVFRAPSNRTIERDARNGGARPSS